MEPEAKARLVIDKKLKDAGWTLQDMEEFDPSASLGVAVREFQITGGGEADYALFVDRKPVGLIEAKASKKGVLLINEASEQNMGYAKAGLKGNYDKNDLRFLFEATDILVQFTDLRDPKPRMRKIFSFYTPEYLAELINDYKQNEKTLRGRMQDFPDLDPQRFRTCQINAITKLEESFALNKPKALIQMATGAGKTYTAITNTYRLLKHAKARRVLFLVDTNNLGAQAEMEYRNYQPYDSPSKFSELYKVQRIQTSNIPKDTVVCISTIQRLYSMLKGEIANFVEGTDDELNDEENVSYVREEVGYNKEYPPEFFDAIFIDECHRSIYNRWKQVLDYFDAFLVGLTATPNVDTYAFFDKNVVSEYTHEQAVKDNVNVAAFDTFVIETEKTKNGGTIARINQRVEIRDKRTRQQKWEEAAEDITYEASDLDRAVVSKDTIRVILETFRDNWKNWIYFQDRDELPKTLIFAKDESHAADIVEIARQVFNEGNDFCKKITYRSEEDEHELLHYYRHAYYPRIAVTVSKIATGTDVKPIEILFFMRNIHDENYYEQMLGRARRTLGKEDLKQTSPSANSDKLGYVIVDAAGVTKSKKIARGRGGRDKTPSIPFKQLIANAVNGDHSDETLSSLGERIERLDKVLTPEERKKCKDSLGISLSELAEQLKDAHDPEKIEEEVRRRAYKPPHEDNKGNPSEYDDIPEDVKEKFRREILKERCEKAVAPLLKPNVRDFLTTIRNTGAQTIDPALDSLRVASFSNTIEETLETTRKNFREFIDAHKDEIDALQIIYNQDFRNRHITEEMIHELYAEMAKVSRALTQPRIFSAYEGKAKTPLRELVDIIQVIRHEWGQIEELVPFADGVRGRYKTWIFTKNKNKGGSRGVSDSPFSDEQLKWLSMIRDHIAMNASIEPEALRFGEFAKNGGVAKYYGLFGDHWKDILEELNVALVA